MVPYCARGDTADVQRGMIMIKRHDAHTACSYGAALMLFSEASLWRVDGNEPRRRSGVM